MFQMTNHDMIPDYLGEFKWDPRFKNHSYSTCVLRLSNCTFYKLHIKNTAYFKSTDVCKKTQLFLKKEKAILFQRKRKLLNLFSCFLLLLSSTSPLQSGEQCVLVYFNCFLMLSIWEPGLCGKNKNVIGISNTFEHSQGMVMSKLHFF